MEFETRIPSITYLFLNEVPQTLRPYLIDREFFPHHLRRDIERVLDSLRPQRIKHLRSLGLRPSFRERRLTFSRRIIWDSLSMCPYLYVDSAYQPPHLHHA